MHFLHRPTSSASDWSFVSLKSKLITEETSVQVVVKKLFLEGCNSECLVFLGTHSGALVHGDVGVSLNAGHHLLHLLHILALVSQLWVEGSIKS